ncbi:hypothetical protein T492DRAFT_835116 [Pavlovales sp. CCMP2436]|nr:hypothetical protein T492DRAFT_835116 [Pavlovales sp. CCMP2436]
MSRHGLRASCLSLGMLMWCLPSGLARTRGGPRTVTVVFTPGAPLARAHALPHSSPRSACWLAAAATAPGPRPLARARASPRAAAQGDWEGGVDRSDSCRVDDFLADNPYTRPRECWSFDLVTDDGIALDARDLRSIRSDWLLDLLSIGDSRILESLSERLVANLLWTFFVLAVVLLDASPPWGLPSLGLRASLAIPSWPLEAGCGLLAIVLVFRTDQSYDRFWEARQRIADLGSVTRSLALLALVHYPPGRARDMLLAHAATFPFALKQHVRGARDLCRLEESWLPYAAPRLGVAMARTELIEMLNEDSVPAALVQSLAAELYSTSCIAIEINTMNTNGNNNNTHNHHATIIMEATRGYAVYAEDSQGQRQAALWQELQCNHKNHYYYHDK